VSEGRVKEVRVSTGEEVLDDALSGGIPKGSSFLIVGPPGSGKTTFAAQFIQSGLEDGEECLFVSTEQTPEGLEASLRRIGFGTGDRNLSVTSMHPKEGRTLEGKGAVLTDLEVENGGAFQKPFNGKYIKERLSEYSACDRVVLDSVSGLESLHSEPEVFRREIIDIVEFVGQEMGATLLMTSEDTDGRKSGPLRYSTDGVLALDKRETDDTEYVVGKVTKMRGTDHDRRTFGVVHDEDGVGLVEPRRGGGERSGGGGVMSTGSDDMDRFCGGVALGGSTVIEHDGLSEVGNIVGGVIDEALSSGMAVFLTPNPSILSSYPFDRTNVVDLLQNNRLFVLDPVGFLNIQSHNIFFESRSLPEVNSVIDDRRGDSPMLVVGNIDIEVATFGREEARRARYENSANLSEEDTVVNVLNSEYVDDKTVSFYRSAAEQVLSIKKDDGVCTVTLTKSSVDRPGKVGFVSGADEPPYYNVV
jgi:KaiC/GvpD/RAD55 family RecA-like ATPase